MTVRNVRDRKNPVARRVFVPVWAERIRVLKRDSNLVVVGAGVHFCNSSRWNMPQGFPDLLMAFESVRNAPRAASRRPPHLRFASASTLQEQISFVRDYGPVLAHNVKGRRRGEGTAACQSITVLQAEQNLFSLWVDLVGVVNLLHAWSLRAFDAREKVSQALARTGSGQPLEVNWTDKTGWHGAVVRGARWMNSKVQARETRKKAEREAIVALPPLLGRIRAAIEAYPSLDVITPDPAHCWRQAWGLAPSPDEIPQYDWLTILSEANELLCRVFNQFKSHLYYGEGSAIEVPAITADGIRPALYFMLRSDYLLKRPFRPCALPDCTRYFVPSRTDSMYCSESCLNKARQRAHYKRNATSKKSAKNDGQRTRRNPSTPY